MLNKPSYRSPYTYLQSRKRSPRVTSAIESALNATSAARIAKAGAGGKRLIDGREKVLIGGIVPTRPSEQEEVDSYFGYQAKPATAATTYSVSLRNSRFGLL